MLTLKHLVINSPAIHAIDYSSDQEVVLAVDWSRRTVGFILSQMGADNKHYPSHLVWLHGIRESRDTHRQRSSCMDSSVHYAISSYLLWVFITLSSNYIKGMINNPDFQPNAIINHWIAGILLFDFRLQHVAEKDHSPMDGLSWRSPVPEDHPEEDNKDNYDDWIDKLYAFAIEVLNHSQISENNSKSMIHQSTPVPHHTAAIHFPSLTNSTPFAFIFSLLGEDVTIPWSEKCIDKMLNYQ